MKTTNRPWIRPNGKPICDSILKRISKHWDAETWEAYLTWYQKPCKEALISTIGYDLICEGMADTIYREYGYDQDELIQKYVEKLLRSLPKVQASVLRLYFLEGLTELQVSKRVRRTQSCVHRRKKKALFALSQKNPEENVIAIHIMRGLGSQIEIETPSIWDSSTGPVCEGRTYDPADHKSELQTIKDPHLKQAISELTERQQRIVYLRFWCNQPDAEIARTFGIGINGVQEICDAAVFRIKSRVVELTQNKKVVSLCA